MEELGATQPLLDEQLLALSHVDRRRLLSALLEENPQEITPGDVGESRGDADAREFLIGLHHRHLPKLEDRGYVEWDQAGRTVSKGPQFEEIRPLLELLDEHRDELPTEWV